MPKIQLSSTPEQAKAVSQSRSRESFEELLKSLDTPVKPLAIDEKSQKRTSEAQLRASKKWQAKQSRMTFRMPPDLREALEAHAAALGESATAFILRAIQSQIERDNQSRQP